MIINFASHARTSFQGMSKQEDEPFYNNDTLLLVVLDYSSMMYEG